MKFKEELKKYQDIVNLELAKYLKKDKCPEEILNSSMEYSLMAGRKKNKTNLSISHIPIVQR